MRVAHVITRMIIGGAQENTLFNCLDLAREFGDDVLLLTGPSAGPEGDLLDGVGREQSFPSGGRFEYRRIDSLRRSISPFDAVAAFHLRKQLAAFQPSIVHTHSAKGGLLGRAVASSLNVPGIVHSVHGAPFHQYQSSIAREVFRRCERWASGRCDAMISVADAMTDLMVGGGVAGPERFTTIASGMDVEPFLVATDHRQSVRRRLGIDPDEVVVGKIARLFKLKGHDDLIDVAAEVIDRCVGQRVRFLWVGDGTLQSHLRDRIAAAGLADHFTLAGLVRPEEVPSMVGAMDLVVHTSYREGLARVLPQAMIAGRPVVSYDIDGAREVVSNQTGALIDAGDRMGLADALVHLIGDADLRHRLGQNGREQFTETFRHQAMTRRIRELYESVLEEFALEGRVAGDPRALRVPRPPIRLEAQPFGRKPVND